MILGFGNNVVSSLASDITAGQTSIPVFPGDGPLFSALLTSDLSNNSTELKNYAKITLTDSGETAFEICHLLSVSGDTLTVVRGQEGTAAKGWSLKDVVANFATRGSENAFTQIAHIQSGFFTAGTAGGTANALTLELPTTFFLNGSSDWTLKTPIVVYPAQNNTGASTLQLTMGGRVLGTFPLYKGGNVELAANDILKDVAMICLMDAKKTLLTVLNPGGIYSSFVPVTRKVNGHQLTKDVDVTSQDIFNGQAVAIGDAVDLNTLSIPGLYYQGADVQAASGKNYPEAAAGSLEIYKHAGITQVYRVYYSSTTYIRTLYNGGWSGWIKRYDAANKPTPTDIGAVSASGGNYNATFRFGSVGTVPTERNTASLVSAQGGNGSIVSGVAFEWYDNAMVLGLVRGNSYDTLGFALWLGNKNLFNIDPNGNAALAGNLVSDGNIYANYLQTSGDLRSERNISSKGIIEAGGRLYDTPGVRVYSPNNMPPQQDLSPYATTSWVIANFGMVNGIRRGGQQLQNPTDAWFGNWESPAGCVVTGITMDGRSDGRKLGVYYRQMQYFNIQSQSWINIGD